MPAIMPPINPNIIAALGQYFGGMQNRTIRTPPFVRPGSVGQRGEVLGRPSMPTPGMPQTMPQPVGGPAPTAPGAAPSPRSLGDQLSRIPTQPTLTPRAPAAAAGEKHPGAHLDPNAAVPTGFEERKWEHDGTRELTSPQGTRYEYDQSGDLISVHKTYEGGTDTAAPSLPDSTAPAAAQGAAPSATPKPAAQRGAKTTYDPDGGYTEEDNDGTKRVFDKDNKLIDTIIPPGSPGAGTWQPPAEAKKPGIWDRLTDPSLAGIALAAGQQMTRARYPGESGIGNAVNAVTAGYNTLAQQRQMQVAREEAARKAALEEREQKRKEQDTTSQAGQRTAQGKRWEDMSADERRKARQAAAQAELDRAEKDRAAGYKGREVTVAEKNAESLKADREARARTDEQRVAALETQVDIAKQELAARIKENATDNERLAAELKVHQGQLDLGWARNQREANKEGNEKFLPFLKEAGDEIYGQERNDLQAAYNSGKPYQPVSPEDHDKKVNALAMKRYREAQRMQGKKGFEEPPNPLGPDIIPPPPGPARIPGRQTPAAQPVQNYGPPAPGAGRVLGPVADPRQEVEGRTGTYNGVPGIVRNGQWVAR